MRPCRTCKQHKSLDMFPTNPAYRDRKGTVCRVCKVAEIQKHAESSETARMKEQWLNWKASQK